MGEKGLTSRVLAPKFGGYLTFGALSPAKASAPGQPTVTELRQLYRLQNQSSATKVSYHTINCNSKSKIMFCMQEVLDKMSDICLKI